MYVKLINPLTRATMVIPCADEVHYEPRPPMSQEEQDAWCRHQEAVKYEPRRLVVWPGDGAPVATVEILLSGRRPTAILTNWNAWLCSEGGRTMERLHRHA